MKLFWSSRSPYVRKVVAAAHEAGVVQQIVLERVVVRTLTPNPAVRQHNPLGKIPTLVLDDGTSLFDSQEICEYLGKIGKTATLFPSAAAGDIARRYQVVGDGLMDLSLLRMGERGRPAELRSAAHDAVYCEKIAAVLDWLDQEAPLFSQPEVSIGTISIACALAYLDFRFAEDNWRTGRHKISAWSDIFRRRTSMLETEFSNEY